ncbi:MAG: peptidoglycan bridge formation glycyltransferase FemA/FemB family protein [Chloroflexota bacterium]
MPSGRIGSSHVWPACIMLELQEIHNPAEWDRALAALPAGHALQSWAWGDFKSRWGWTAQRLLWTRAGLPAAAAQILRRSIPRTPWSFLYTPKGPAMDYADLSLVEQILAGLETYARRRQTLFIKIDPDVRRQVGEPQPNSVLDLTGAGVLRVLDRRGWRFSPEQIQFRNTIVIDLTPEPEELLAAMKSKWRYNIRLAGRRGVELRRGAPADLDAFYRLYAATGARDGFLIRPKDYYLDVWSQFLSTGQAELLLAVVAGETVAGLMLFVFAGTAWYMYGASTDQARQLMPNYALQWAAICRARERGCRRYDLWGAPDVFDESDRLWGVYRFKQGFGGEVVQGLGAFDYPVKRRLYWAFNEGLPRLRALIRRVKAG